MNRDLHLVWMAFNRRWVMCIALLATIMQVFFVYAAASEACVRGARQHDCGCDRILTFFATR